MKISINDREDFLVRKKGTSTATSVKNPKNKSLAEKLQRVLSLSPSTAFGCGNGSVKALSSVDNCVFTAHQDRQIRVWEVSRG
ncbi:hypothetical protein QJS10_CPB11g02377 [Acorus calamus]|uniref:Uncharacterized protein n=1 Tax=Acorus calamus TaxID=4465 RepID=A0AAV9DV42_ACOCL|nr:hypothetical protein QJS10_CPB11g02377 [Acorus calamus]